MVMTQLKCQVVKDDGKICLRPAIGVLDNNSEYAVCYEHAKSVLGLSNTDVKGLPKPN